MEGGGGKHNKAASGCGSRRSSLPVLGIRESMKKDMREEDRQVGGLQGGSGGGCWTRVKPSCSG